MATSRVVVTTGIYPPDVGGPATYVERLTRQLVQDGRSVSVLTTTDQRGRVANLGALRLVSVSRRQPLGVRIARSTSRVAIDARGACGIYANGLYAESAVAARIARVPLVVKVVGDYSWETAYNEGTTTLDIDQFQDSPRLSRRARAVRALQRWWCRSAVKVVVSSEFLAALVRRWGVEPDRLAVIPNAVEVPGPPSVATRRADPGRLRAVTGGRLLGWKRMDRLVLLARECPGLELSIVGAGPEHSRLARLIDECSVGSRVRLCGPVAPGDMSSVYAEHDVFLLASTSETFSYMTIEAMAHGLPVVVANRGALPEVAGDGRWGVVCEAGDLEAWRSAVHRLATDDDWFADLARRGYEAASTIYSWEPIYRRTVGMLDGIFGAG